MAEKSLRFYRNCSRSKWSEQEAQLQVELQKMDDIAKSKVGKPKLTCSDFCKYCIFVKCIIKYFITEEIVLQQIENQ